MLEIQVGFKEKWREVSWARMYVSVVSKECLTVHALSQSTKLCAFRHNNTETLFLILSRNIAVENKPRYIKQFSREPEEGD